jgi:hypothetical protein
VFGPHGYGDLGILIALLIGGVWFARVLRANMREGNRRWAERIERQAAPRTQRLYGYVLCPWCGHRNRASVARCNNCGAPRDAQL